MKKPMPKSLHGYLVLRLITRDKPTMQPFRIIEWGLYDSVVSSKKRHPHGLCKEVAKHVEMVPM